MIVTRLILKPFGCFGNKTLDFSAGLNVVLGPNEAGKSTTFQAFQKVLFVPARLTKPVFRREMQQYIPLGGDTSHVELTFQRAGEAYTLQRTWGATREAELLLPGGVKVTDEQRIAEVLNELLPAAEGTFRSVLMSYQTGLSRTIEELRSEHSETLQSLGDILRKAVLETDGVSVDRFKENLDQHYHDYFSRWDPERNGPDGGKGIHNPWKKEVGHILRAYYDMETVEVALREARVYEEEYDNLSIEMRSLDEKVSSLGQYLLTNKKVVEDARERRVLETEAALIETRVALMTAVNEDWPVRENKVEELKGRAPRIDHQIAALDVERAEAERQLAGREDREKLKRALEKKAELDAAVKKLNSAQKLTNEECERIREASLETEKLKLQIMAGRLALSIQAKESVTLSIQRDLDQATSEELAAGQGFKVEAGGMLRIEHPDMSLEIVSGQGDVKDTLEKHETANQRLSELLRAHSVSTVEEAQRLSALYGSLEDEVARQRDLLNSQLGDESLESLQAKVQALGEEKPMRPHPTIIDELTALKMEQAAVRGEIAGHEKAIDEYQGTYGDKRRLLLEVAGAVHKQQELLQTIKSLAPLPEGVVDAASLIKAYETTQEEFRTEEKTLASLKERKAVLEAKAPEMSAEELSGQLAEAQEQFLRVHRRGLAIARIKTLTESLLEEMDMATHESLKRDLKHFLSSLTGHRYDEVELEGGIPTEIITKDGKAVACDLLSTGTKDALSLALRLAMSNHFLKEADGLIIMDDPLVNLDPKRQKKAAELLREYAEHRQVIVFTCHPSHAELLGGRRIELT